MTAHRTSNANSRAVVISLVLLFCVLFICGRISMGRKTKNASKAPSTTRSSLPLPPQKRLHVHVTKVSDGDTIKVVAGDYSDFDGELRVRLRYIDTPEKAQPYGPEATQYLKNLLDGGKKVSISFEEYDMYNRALGVVYYGRSNVNRLLLKDGFAWCYRNTCPKSYSSVLKTAQDERKGLWAQSNPQSPWEYRAEKRRYYKRKRELWALLSSRVQLYWLLILSGKGRISFSRETPLVCDCSYLSYLHLRYPWHISSQGLSVRILTSVNNLFFLQRLKELFLIGSLLCDCLISAYTKKLVTLELWRNFLYWFLPFSFYKLSLPCEF